MGAFPPGELARREQLRDEAFRTAGITFTVYGESEGVERTFPLDLVPRVIPHDEWDHLERGLVQRITVLNRLLEDLYFEERAAVRDGVIPWWLMASSTGFVREAAGTEVPHAARCLVARAFRRPARCGPWLGRPNGSRTVWSWWSVTRGIHL